MKRSKKLIKKLNGRIYDWEQMMAKNPGNRKAYRKPGSVKKG